MYDKLFTPNMYTKNITPKSIRKVYHPTQKRWIIRYYYGSKKLVDQEGKTKYKTFQQDEYPDIGWIKDPKNAYERQCNKKAERLLDNAIEEKNVDLRKGRFGMLTNKDKKANMLDDFEKYYKNRYTSKNSLHQHATILGRLKLYVNSDYISWLNINESFCLGFLDFLQNHEYVRGKLNKNTIKSYFNAFKFFLGVMKEKGKLLTYPANNIKAKGEPSKMKQRLTKEEIQILIKTDILAHSSIKPFFLFSCLTGQAHEECRLLSWNMIEEEDDRFYIKATRRKTSQPYRIPINKQAMKFLGKRPKDGNQKVFPSLKYSAQQNQIIQEWISTAGIDKKVTPHVARHSFSSMYYLITKDIGALMMILNHKDISTTQRYLASLLGTDYFDNKDVELPTFDIKI